MDRYIELHTVIIGVDNLMNICNEKINDGYKTIVAGFNLPKYIKKSHLYLYSWCDLSSYEANLCGLMLTQVSESDWDDSIPVYVFRTYHLFEWLNVESSSISSELKSVIERLKHKKIGFISRNSSCFPIEYEYIFEEINYTNGKLTMIPNPKLKHLFLESGNKGFSLVPTVLFFELQSKYAKRLYEILCRFKNKKFFERTYDIDVLKGIFGLLDENGVTKYKSFQKNSNVLTRCLDVAITCLNSHPEIRSHLSFQKGNTGKLGYDVLKKGRNIIGIKFRYVWVNDEKSKNAD